MYSISSVRQLNPIVIRPKLDSITTVTPKTNVRCSASETVRSNN